MLNTLVLNRKQYKAIKKYDHQQMNDWATSIYKSGYTDAMQKFNNESISLKDVENAIDKVKGIGEKRKQAIIQVLNETLKGGKDEKRNQN